MLLGTTGIFATKLLRWPQVNAEPGARLALPLSENNDIIPVTDRWAEFQENNDIIPVTDRRAEFQVICTFCSHQFSSEWYLCT